MTARASRIDAALLVAFVASGALCVIGALAAPDRFWPGYLVAFVILSGLGLAGIFFVAVHYVAKAGWGAVIRRIPEAMSYTLAGAALMAAPLVIGAHRLYEWSHADAVAHDAILAGKSAWLNIPFFFGRTFLFFAVWILFARVISANSVMQDGDGKLMRTKVNVRLSAAFLPIFAITVSLAAFDWLMSLEPHWYSTIFGAYVFAGFFQSGIAVMIVAVILLRKFGAFGADRFSMLSVPGAATVRSDDLVSDHHYHDLGKLLFAFSCFWAYLWFCQYMLIWYANIPEETVYFVRRQVEGWNVFLLMNLVLNWMLPFLAIMARTSKRNELRLFLVACGVIAGRWLDVHLMVTPVFFTAPVIGIWEIAPAVFASSLFCLLLRRRLRAVSLVPVKDPYLPESLHLHQ